MSSVHLGRRVGRSLGLWWRQWGVQDEWCWWWWRLREEWWNEMSRAGKHLRGFWRSYRSLRGSSQELGGLRWWWWWDKMPRNGTIVYVVWCDKVARPGEHQMRSSGSGSIRHGHCLRRSCHDRRRNGCGKKMARHGEDACGCPHTHGPGWRRSGR